MAITPNNTLPDQWRDNIVYSLGATVSFGNIIFRSEKNNNLNHNPGIDQDQVWWKALDIYKKEFTVMPHGNYSGDANLWDRDNIYIDADTGYVYVNNENTGINVNGRINYQLTDNQLSEIANRVTQLIPVGPKGEKGDTGEPGEKGDPGSQGPPGQTGQDGKSAYECWLEAGHTGSETDFMIWLRSNIITLDTELSKESNNGVTNTAISTAFENYQNDINTLISSLEQRVASLEGRLQQRSIEFRFGVTTEGEYGYYISGTDQIIPFANQDKTVLATYGIESNNPSVFQTQFGYSNVDVANTEIDSQYTSPTSLSGEVSGTEEEPTSIYGINVRPMNINEALEDSRYIFNNGAFQPGYNFNLYSMVVDTELTGLLSKNAEDIEGIYFEPNSSSVAGTYINFVVEPVHSEDTIYYEAGVFTNPNDKLPDVVETVSGQQGQFDSRTTITQLIDYTKGVYFASTQQSEYRIVSIYIN